MQPNIDLLMYVPINNYPRLSKATGNVISFSFRYTLLDTIIP